MVQTGEILKNRYQIQARLGQGGMGTVYRALDLEQNNLVAVKELRLDDLPTDPDGTRMEDGTRQHGAVGLSRQAALRQFQREAELICDLSSPHLPKIIETFDLDGQGYFVMTLIEGRNLAEVVKNAGGALPEAQVRDIFAQIAEVLAECHARHIIHRDIKPENLILDSSGQIYLVDFGIAKRNLPAVSPVTTVAARAFTEFFSPPEQRQGGGGTDERTDIYALGAVLYFLLSGVPPLDALERSSGSTLKRLRSFNPQVSPELENLITRCIRLDKNERPASIAAVVALLHQPVPSGGKDSEPAERQFEQDQLLHAALKNGQGLVYSEFQPPSISADPPPRKPTPLPEVHAQPASPSPISEAAQQPTPINPPIPKPSPIPEVHARPAVPAQAIPPTTTAGAVQPPTPANPPRPQPVPIPEVRARPAASARKQPAIPGSVNIPTRQPRRDPLHPPARRRRVPPWLWLWLGAGLALIAALAFIFFGSGWLSDPHSPRMALRNLSAAGDAYEVVEGQNLQVDQIQGLLANDQQVDLTALKLVIHSWPSNGLLQLLPDGSFSYAPQPGFTGREFFAYQYVPRLAGQENLHSVPIPVVISVRPLYRIWLPVIGK